MEKRILQIAFLLYLPCNLIASMTIQINSAPQLTPLFDTIYVAGTFNDWNEADADFMMTEDNQTWTISIDGTENETIEFKFTRGSWTKVEGNALGTYIPNRSMVFHNNTTQSYSIEGWEDLAGAHSVTENVRILDTDFVIPQLNRTRRIWINLPENYDASSEHYPVLYFHDGQNVFDAATSFSSEWQVDETIQELAIPGCNETIVVAVDNGGSSRIDEYSPWLNADYNEGGEGAAYSNFIIETLKPVIDENFRTLTDRDHTSTAGSSLGALIAIYLVSEHNDVFSKAGIFSPAFWFNPEIFEFVQNSTLSSDTKIYFVCGDSESSDMVNDMQQMYDAVTTNNVPTSNLNYVVQNGGTHSEYWWRQYFPNMFTAIYECINSVAELSSGYELHVFPNPVQEVIQFSISNAKLMNIQVVDSSGKLIVDEVMGNNKALDVSALSAGVYTLRCSFIPENTSTVLSRNTSFIKK